MGADAGYWCEELAKTAGTKDARRLCRNDLADTAEELVEALASLVEFDGLETTWDPSPRSSLMLGMYTPQKGAFVYRTTTLVRCRLRSWRDFTTRVEIEERPRPWGSK